MSVQISLHFNYLAKNLFQSQHTMKLSTVVNAAEVYAMPGWDGRTIWLNMIEFDGSVFDPKAFGVHHIVCPPFIASSVLARQADYFFGRLAARRALEALGMGHDEIGTGASREPLWPLGIIGSISHNRNRAVAVAIKQESNGGMGVGIDIESVLTPEVGEMLQESVLSTGELDYLRALKTNLPLNTLISLVFSAKESFFKASFNTVARYFDFDAIEVLEVDLRARSIAFIVKVQLAPQLPAGVIRKVQFMMVDASTMLTSCHLPPGLGEHVSPD